jgi:hypothetical protein
MRIWALIFILSFGMGIESQQQAVMFNAFDSCSPWPAQKTAKYLINLDANNRNWEFGQLGPVVLLVSPISADSGKSQPYAIFFDDQKSCVIFIKQLQN